jgi:hypothetical protein
MLFWGGAFALMALFYLTLMRNKVHDPLSELEINADAYSLVIMAALGQAYIGSSSERAATFGPIGASLFCMVVAGFQCTLIYLLVAGINPHSMAVATEPAHAWMTERHVLAVSAMKWLMAFVLVLKTTSEVEESKYTMRISLEITEERLSCSRWLPFLAGLLQYFVSLAIVFAGCAAVLSFQETPDIVYSGLAVCFLTEMDDLMCEYFTVTIRKIHTIKQITVEEDVDKVPTDDWRRTGTYHFALRALSFLPGLLAFYVVGRAFASGNTPIRMLHRFGITPHVNGPA